LQRPVTIRSRCVLLEPQILARLYRISRCYAQPSEHLGEQITSKEWNHIEQVRRSRIDYQLIESLIEPQSRVLDVGCGDGSACGAYG